MLQTPATPQTPRTALLTTLQTLQTKSSTSTPDLSSQARKLIAVFSNGEDTTQNGEGMTQFKNVVETLNMFVDRVTMRDVRQASRVSSLKLLLSSLSRTLKSEGDDEESDTYPLLFFADTDAGPGSGSVFERWIVDFGSQVRLLQELVCPTQPAVAFKCDLSGADIDTTHPTQRGGNIGYLNQGGGGGGGQIHSYVSACIQTGGGAIASGNILPPATATLGTREDVASLFRV